MVVLCSCQYSCSPLCSIACVLTWARPSDGVGGRESPISPQSSLLLPLKPLWPGVVNDWRA